MTACIVDAPSAAFQCSENGERQFQLELDKGKSLECMSTQDAEAFLKECKKGEIIVTTLCKYDHDETFVCIEPSLEKFEAHLLEVDNYFCLTPQNRKRVIERCKDF